MIMPDPSRERARPGGPNTLVRALGYLGRYRKLALAAYVSLTVSSFGALIVPFLTRTIIDQGITGQERAGDRPGGAAHGGHGRRGGRLLVSSGVSLGAGLSGHRLRPAQRAVREDPAAFLQLSRPRQHRAADDPSYQRRGADAHVSGPGFPHGGQCRAAAGWHHSRNGGPQLAHGPGDGAHPAHCFRGVLQLSPRSPGRSS